MDFHTVLTAIYVGIVVLILFGATIFVHELGHFLFARRYKLRIERFSIGFGPKLWGFTKDGVEYRISAFPFGGYVALPQMSPLEEEEKKKFDPPLEEAKPFHKIVVAMAGAAFNVLFALVLALLLWKIGKPIDASERDLHIGYVPTNSPESKAGLRMQDEIVAINGAVVHDWSDVHQAVAFSRRELIQIDFRREGALQPPVEIKPARSKLFGVRWLEVDPKATPKIERLSKAKTPTPAQQAGLKKGDQILEVDGIQVLSVGHFLDLVGERGNKPSQFKIRREGQEMLVAVTPLIEKNTKRAMIGVRPAAHTNKIPDYPNPWKQFKEVVLMMANTINALVHHKETGVGVKDLSGPVGIGHALWLIIPTDIRLGISFTVLLNINLALINLLPIPVLDGGHIMFALFEWARRKPIAYKFAAATQTAFAVLLIGFILYVTYFDLLRTGLFSRPERSELEFEEPPSTSVPAQGTSAPATP